MKRYLPILFFAIAAMGCQAPNSLSTADTSFGFLYKTNLDTSFENKGQHIEVRGVLPDTDELLPMSIDDRDIISRSGYSRSDEIKILGAYLRFRGDTAISNKKYHFKPAYHMVHPEGIPGFTIQIEALYSFTRMLMTGYPPIRPMLVDRTTGEQVNTDPDKVGAVYDIYGKWYRDNLRSDFKRIVFPLSGSRYCWLGQEKDLKPYLKTSL